MSNQHKFFFRGVLRIGAGAIAAALVFFAFNVIGYLAIKYDLVFWANSVGLERADSYWNRVSLLALVGVFQVVCCIGIACLAWIVLKGCYYGIIYIGGYREPEDKPC